MYRHDDPSQNASMSAANSTIVTQELTSKQKVLWKNLQNSYRS